MNAETLLKGLLYFILKAKYLKRERIKNRWKYWYKPESQRGAHEFTKKKFEQKTKLTDSTHKDAIEKILQNNGHVNLRILRDYPDLAKKYHQESRIVAADKIRAKVKASKESAQPKVEQKLDDSKSMKQVVTPTQKMKALEGSANIWNGTRAYFKAKDFVDVEWEYKNGKLRGAIIDGEELSATKANQLKSRLFDAKVYYDSVSDSIVVTGLDEFKDDITNSVSSYIDKKVKELPKETPKQVEPVQENQIGTPELDSFMAIPDEQKRDYAKDTIKTREGFQKIINQQASKIEIKMPELKTFSSEYQKEQVLSNRESLANAIKQNIAALTLSNILSENQTGEEKQSSVEGLDYSNKIKEGLEKLDTTQFILKYPKQIQRVIQSNGVGLIHSFDELKELSEAISKDVKETTTKEKIASNKKTDFSQGIEGGYDKGILVSKVQMKDGSTNYKLRSPYIPELIKAIQEVKKDYYSYSKADRQKLGSAPSFNPSDKSWYFGEGMRLELEPILREYLHKD